MAALNSAYIVSDGFLTTLITKINISFTAIQKDLVVVDDIQQQTHSKLIVDGARVSAPAREKIKKLNDRSEDLRKKVGSFEDRLLNTIAKNSISTSFNYLCWVGALYCVAILIANGFELRLDIPFVREMFFVTNVVLIVLIILIFREENLKWFNPSYKRVAAWFFLIVVLVPAIVYLLDYYLFSLGFGYPFNLTCKISALIIPISHFVYFFLKAIRVTHKECKKLVLEKSEIEQECRNFALEIRSVLETLGDIGFIEQVEIS